MLIADYFKDFQLTSLGLDQHRAALTLGNPRLEICWMQSWPAKG
jgi:hypothetical protein